MTMKSKLLSIVFGLAILSATGCAMLSEPGDNYRNAMTDIKNGRSEFGFVYLKRVVESGPSSSYAPAAKFAVGEHYFDNYDYYNAIETLSDYLLKYPKDKGAVFAKLLIYKMIADIKNAKISDIQHEALIKEIRKELFSKPLFLIFYDKKSPRSYKSLFKNTYLVYDYVDKIRVLRNDKIFLELSP